jgi:putative membrane protein
MRRRSLREKQPVWGKGVLAGAIGGLVGSWTMNQFQALLNLAGKKPDDGTDRKRERHPREQPASEEDGDATQRTASHLAHALLGRELTKQERDVAGPIVHYAFGSVSGGLYGAAAELSAHVSAGFGLPFAAVLWLAADEAAVPALGLSRPALDYPLSSHLSALAAHAVYGFTTELVRRSLRSAL